MVSDISIILQSHIINYPVSKDLGTIPVNPIALVFESNANMMPFIYSLCRHPRIVDVSTCIATAKKHLTEANSDGVFLILEPETLRNASIKTVEKRNLFRSAAMRHKIDDQPTESAVFYCFQGFIPPSFSEDVFEIRIPSQTRNGSNSDLLELVPEPSQLELVRDKIKSLNNISEESKWVYGAVAFMYPKLAEKERYAFYEMLLEEAEALTMYAEAFKDEGTITELVICFLLDYADNGEFDDTYELPELQEKSINPDWFDERYFFRGKYLYLSEKRFKTLLTPIFQTVPVNMVKAELVRQEILISDSGGYTTKMTYFDCERNLSRVRMMKLDMQKISDKRGSLESYILAR